MDLRVMHTRDAIHSLHSCLKQSSCTALWGTWSAHCAHPWQPLSLECHPSNTQEDIIDTFLGSTIRVAFSAHTPALLVGCQTKHIAISKGNNAAVQTVLVLGCVSGREPVSYCDYLWHAVLPPGWHHGHQCITLLNKKAHWRDTTSTLLVT